MTVVAPLPRSVLPRAPVPWRVPAASLPAPVQGLLQRLAEGPVIGDGGYVMALERRGYVHAGLWTPEVAKEHPETRNFIHNIL